MLDECLNGLADAFDGSLVVTDAAEFGRGIPDPQLVEKVFATSAVLITQDAGKRGAPISRICTSYGVTHVIMRGKLSQAKRGRKIEALNHLCEHLDAVFALPLGTRVRLWEHSAKGAVAIKADYKAGGEFKLLEKNCRKSEPTGFWESPDGILRKPADGQSRIETYKSSPA